MAYNFLDKNFNSIGVLTNTGGQLNNYWGDQITHSIATSNDVLTSVSLSIDKATKNIDTNGNQKEWNHTIQGLSFGIDGIGKNVDELNYVVYQDGDQGHYYLMTITQVDESLTTSGFHFKTIQGINSAAYDLSRKTLKPADFAIVPTGTQKTGSAQNILKYIFSDLGWDVRVIGNFPSIDYTITDSVSAQSVLQDVIKLFDAEVDAHVLINNISSGSNVFTGAGSIKRVFEFSTAIGNDNGDVVRLNRNLVSLTKTGARDSLYTKLYVTGNEIDIAPANNGANFIYDDNANRKYNSIGANSTPVQYLEGVINNSEIKNPQALLTWGKKQLKALNHPRYNYTVTSINGKNVHLGDDVVVQDLKASQPIILKSKIISKTISFADPQTDSFILGEFSPIVVPTKNNDSNNIVQLVNKANQVATEALNKSENTQKGLSDLTDTVDKVQEQATQAVVSANGKNKIYTGRTKPEHPQEGDTWYWEDGENSGFKVFKNGDWVDAVDTKTQERITNAVDSAIDTSKKYADDLNAEQAKLTSDLSEKVDKSVKELTDSQQAISSQATAYTNSAVADANAKAVQIGQTTAQNAQKSLDEAKKDFTNSYASQASQTASMASDVTSKANQYASQAKSEAVAVATSADGVVRSEFKFTTDSMTATIQQNKSDADGKITKAQTTATQALDGLSTKVERTEYNQTTGDLTTKINTTSDTAEKSKQDIADIKDANGKQDERMLQIEKDATGVKQTVSDLSTEQGKQRGSISKLEQRADGFEATVTKVNNLAVGGRNLLLNSKILSWVIGNNTATTSTKVSYDSATNMWHITSPKGGSGNAGIYFSQTDNVSNIITKGQQWAFSFDIKGTGVYSQFGIEGSSPFNKLSGNVPTDWTRVSSTGTASGTGTKSIIIYFNSIDVALDVYIKLPKLELGSVATDWTPAPEDVDSAVAKAQLTADNATLAINNYKTDADGRISKAQADIKVNADAIATKVAKTDYDKKTGDLTTSINKAQQTADSATQTIGTYKESNDKRVYAAETNIKANSDAIALTVSKTDFNQATGKLSGDISTLQQRADGFDATVTKVNNLAVGGRNLLLGTGDWSGDFLRWDMRGTLTTDTYRGMVIASASTMWTSPVYHTQYAGVMQVGKTYTFSTYVRNTSDTDVKVFAFYDDKIVTPDGYTTSLPAHTDWTRLSTTFKVIADPTTSPNGLRWESNQDLTNGQFQLAGYKLEEGNVPTDWTQAPEDVDTQLAQVKITADGVYQTVNDPTTGIATRLLTAEGSITTVQSKTNELTSKQTLTANGLTREIADRKTGDSNTLQAGKDFTTSQISNSETGMKSFVNQTISGLQIGVIKDDVSSLKDNVIWKQTDLDDMNHLTTSGNYFVQSGAGTNSPFKPWFYITVDAPRTDRITQIAWKDSDSNLTYKRSLFGTTWSSWSQVVSSATLLSIFHDSWSLGTTTNDGITKQMITGIMGQPDGTLILKGNSLILDGNTTVTGDFYAKGGNFKNLNASNMTLGTLNASDVNIININANNIVTGSIRGNNLDMNLNTGEVEFRQGRIHSQSGNIDMNIDQGYLSVTNSQNNVLIKDGEIAFTHPDFFSPSTDPYLRITNSIVNGSFSFGTIQAKNGLELNSKGNESTVIGSVIGIQKLSGIKFGKNNKGTLEETLVGGANKGVIISGGAGFGTMNTSPYIRVGSNRDGNGTGNHIVLDGEWVHSKSTYVKTSSEGANVHVNPDGALVRSTSARKYKTNIKRDVSIDDSQKLLNVPLSTWDDIAEIRDTGSSNRYFGMIAEDLADAGLDYLVTRGEDNQIEGIEYSRVALLLIPIVKKMQEEIKSLRDNISSKEHDTKDE